VLFVTSYALYLDAAGHPSDRPILGTGGFLSTESSWLAFEPAWKDVLKRNDLPEVFHMTDFEYRFKNHPRHWDILRELIDVISRYALASFSNTVNMEAYRKINDRYPLEEMFGKPYGISASAAARLARHWQGVTNHNGELLVLVEQGTMHEGDMIECFLRDGLNAPIPVPKDLPAAQAADLFSWERAWYNNTSIRRPSLVYLKEKMPDGMRGLDGKWEKRSLDQALRKLEMPRREELPEKHSISFHTSPKKFRKRTIR